MLGCNYFAKPIWKICEVSKFFFCKQTICLTLLWVTVSPLLLCFSAHCALTVLRLPCFKGS